MDTTRQHASRLFSGILERLEEAFRQLEDSVPAPVRKPWLDGFVFRYAEQNIQQAIVQKMARVITGLRSIQLLWREGLFQEQGTIQRVVDELIEDIEFLSLALVYNEVTNNHIDYLAYFYAEEFGDPGDIMGSHTSRGMIPRKKIRAFINAKLGDDASRANVAGRILAKSYSGFVHAASPHIMDMCAGAPPKFDISGVWRNVRSREFSDDALNYFFRAAIASAFAAKAFGKDQLMNEVQKLAGEVTKHMEASAR